MAARVPASTQDDPGLAPVSSLPGVGPSLRQTLERLGIARVQDLWFHLPLRYEDRTRITAIRDLRIGEAAQVEGVVEAAETGFRYRAQLRVAITDDSQSTLVLRFFHFRRAQVERLMPGTRLRCYGEVRHGAHGPEMVHPQYQVVHGTNAVEERLTPVYPATEGIGQQRLRAVIAKSLERLPEDATLELIPAPLREPLDLPSLREALQTVHRPPPDADTNGLARGTHPVQQRLAFEELLTQHLSLKRMRAQVRVHRAPALPTNRKLHQRFIAALPFELTRAQRRVAGEIADDLAGATPMLRLVQGDVGSGKTVVAALAALSAIANDHQVALMAPTELLAEQHLRCFRQWFEPFGIDVIWLAGKVQGRARQSALAAVASGAPVVIGTHALMQEGVAFKRLGLAIVDEQHRFGVQQRMALRDKGAGGDSFPHQLVLTATPIPRTLAMSVYADLDISALDELPPGRLPVQTVAVSNTRRHEVIERIRAACAEGRQAYWVCTIIEESEQLVAQAAEVTHAELSRALPELKVGLLHGRMKPAEKQATMDAFKAGEVALLVATTV
ncbi:MAG TPA: ATP-dependent DNA helicase RecG, partial [Rhodanobacteraceae bacterium]|nr:ATP-dependent DNA helicase RecG [Rhodanobacteraceae bacterium]